MSLLFLLSFFLYLICVKACFLSNDTIICHDFMVNDDSDETIVKLSNQRITKLFIEKSIVNLVDKESFMNFPNLKELMVRDSQVMFLEHDTFEDHEFLTHLDFSDNFLNHFNSLDNLKDLEVLNLSDNLLRDFKFQIDDYPKLQILDISQNLIEKLPIELLNRSRDLKVIYNDNPFVCQLEMLLCNGEKIGNFRKLKLQPLLMEVAENRTENKKNYCIKNCHFMQCLIWSFTGIWLGIIIGNICKIKKLLFIKPKRADEKGTQCDKVRFRKVRHFKDQVIFEDVTEVEDLEILEEPSSPEEKTTLHGMHYIFRQ